MMTNLICVKRSRPKGPFRDARRGATDANDENVNELDGTA
jgi:hypothetical protein